MKLLLLMRPGGSAGAGVGGQPCQACSRFEQRNWTPLRCSRRMTRHSPLTWRCLRLPTGLRKKKGAGDRGGDSLAYTDTCLLWVNEKFTRDNRANAHFSRHYDMDDEKVRMECYKIARSCAVWAPGARDMCEGSPKVRAQPVPHQQPVLYNVTPSSPPQPQRRQAQTMPGRRRGGALLGPPPGR